MSRYHGEAFRAKLAAHLETQPEKHIRPSRWLPLLTAIVTLSGLATGCGTCSRNLNPFPGAQFDPNTPGSERTLRIQYLGSGGFLMRRGNDALLTAPFYSNPGMLRVGLSTISSDTNEVERLLPDVHDVKAILAGHSHYDHIMDLPYVANHRATNAIIYGNNTMSNILGAAIDHNRLVGMNPKARFVTGDTNGAWVYVTNQNIRFMALRSEHSPHLGCIKLFSGEVCCLQTELPRRASGWKEGQTLAFLIDFLGSDGRIDYRISYHDTAMNCPPYGGMPELPPGEQRDPDVAILCMGASRNVKNYPDGIVNTQHPKHVVVGHWDNFFKSQAKQSNCVEVVPLGNGKKFMTHLREIYPEGQTTLPKPGATISFMPDEAGNAARK